MKSRHYLLVHMIGDTFRKKRPFRHPRNSCRRGELGGGWFPSQAPFDKLRASRTGFSRRARHSNTPAGHSDPNTAVEHADRRCKGWALAY